MSATVRYSEDAVFNNVYIEPTTTTEVPMTTTEEESTIAVVTTTEAPTPPSPDKKGKVLPRTGEESGLVASLVGLALLAVVSIAVIFYRISQIKKILIFKK